MTSLTGNPYDTGRLHDILTHHLRNIQSTLDALVYDVVRDITTSRQVLSSVIGIIRLPPGSLPDCMLCLGFCCILTTTCNDSTVQRRFFADSRRMALLPLRKAFTPPPFPQYQVLCIRTAAHLQTSAASCTLLSKCAVANIVCPCTHANMRASRWRTSVLCHTLPATAHMQLVLQANYSCDLHAGNKCAVPILPALVHMQTSAASKTVLRASRW